MDVHPVPPRFAEASQLQLPRSGPDGQPIESSQLAPIVLATGGLGLASATNPAFADITGFIYNNTVYDQTSNSTPSASSGYFFSIGADFTNPGDYANATATYPGPASPQSLPANGSTEFNFSSTLYPSLSDLRTNYPFGNYQITAGGGALGNATSVIPYTADNFTNSVPYLTNYSSLNGLNPGASFTVNFPPFTPNPAATEGFTFFTIFDAGGSAVFSDEFQDPSSTSATITANTLLPNMTYDFELDFSDRLNGFDAVNSQNFVQGSDVRTDGSFTTGPLIVPAPEPASLALLGSALLGFGVIRRRRR